VKRNCSTHEIRTRSSLDYDEEVVARDYEDEIFACDYKDEVFAQEYDEDLYGRNDENLHAGRKFASLDLNDLHHPVMIVMVVLGDCSS
jgi:hypothetical protein